MLRNGSTWDDLIRRTNPGQCPPPTLSLSLSLSATDTDALAPNAFPSDASAQLPPLGACSERRVFELLLLL